MTEDRYHTFALSGDCSVKSIGTVAAQLRAALPRHPRLAVDTSGITAADLTTAQLLLAVRRSAAANGQAFGLKDPVGKPLRDFVVAAGLTEADGADFWTTPIPSEQLA